MGKVSNESDLVNKSSQPNNLIRSLSKSILRLTCNSGSFLTDSPLKAKTLIPIPLSPKMTHIILPPKTRSPHENKISKSQPHILTGQRLVSIRSCVPIPGPAHHQWPLFHSFSSFPFSQLFSFPSPIPFPKLMPFSNSKALLHKQML